MNVAMVVHEFKMLMRNRKNVLFLIAVVSLILTYAFLVQPTMETPDSFDVKAMQDELSNLDAIQESMIARAGTGYGPLSGNPYARSVYESKVQSRMVHAFLDGDLDRFSQLRMKGFDYDTENATQDWMLHTDARYPALDAERDLGLKNLRYQGYIDADSATTYEMIEQKTALQTIVNFLRGTAAALVVFVAIYFSSDMITKDRQHQSLIQGMPIGWYRLINLKSLVAFIYTLIVLFGLFLLTILVIGMQHGFGSFQLSVPVTIPSTEPDDYFGYRFSEFDTISYTKFFLLVLGMIPILSLLFIRINAILSLVFKNSWLVLMISTVILFSERIYYSRTLTELLGIEISYFPQTYFDFGRIISGEKYYLVHLESIDYQQGIIVLLITLLIIEVILFLVSRIVNKRSFYRDAA